MRLIALIAFGGDCQNYDPDAAAEALRAAGYDVHRMPAVHPKLGHPLDDHIEAFIEGPPVCGDPPSARLALRRHRTGRAEHTAVALASLAVR